MSASAEVAARLGIVPPTDLAAFWDAPGLHSLPGPGEFAEAVPPDRVGRRWPGQVPPDLVPVAGNGAGDMLCARIGLDGTVTGYAAWVHDAHAVDPRGATLAEAVLVDAALSEGGDPTGREWITWAWAHLGGADGPPPEQPAGALASLGLGIVPLAEAACRDALSTAWERTLCANDVHPSVQALGIAWRDLPRWRHEPATAPDGLAALAPDAGVQDWPVAVALAGGAGAVGADVAWPAVVLGWAAERDGDASGAIALYRRGLRSPARSLGFATALFPGLAHRRFEARRLAEMLPGVPDDPLLAAWLTPPRDHMDSPVSRHLQDVAQAAGARGDHAAAVRALYDSLYLDSFTPQEVVPAFTAMAASARALGATAWVTLIEMDLAGM